MSYPSCIPKRDLEYTEGGGKSVSVEVKPGCFQRERKRGLETKAKGFVWFLGQRSLAGYSPQGHKESDMTEQLTLWEGNT